MLIASIWSDLFRTLTLDAAHNTIVVMRGTTVLGLACGVVGAFLLLRKRSLVADALSHAALPGVCVGFLLAGWLGIDGRSLGVLMPAAAIFGLLGVASVHGLTRVPRIKEDAAIGVVLSVFFALGIVLLSVIQQRGDMANKAGLNRFIFGQAATMSAFDSNLIALLALLVIVVASAHYKELRLLCFDPSYAGSLGWSTLALDGLLLAMVTTLTVIGLNAVGAILMVALLIIPPAAARFWTHRLWAMIVLSALIGAAACYVGAAASAVVGNLPTGPAIVVSCGSLFIVSMLAAPRRGLVANLFQRIQLRRTVARQHLLRAMYEQGEISGTPGAAGPVKDRELLGRRSWTLHRLHSIARRLIRRGELARSAGGGYVLTASGGAAAAKIVRTHRLWEHFLTTQADIAPSHVDRAADDIEHVLSDELIEDLESELRAKGALPEGEFVPRSPHVLASAHLVRRKEVIA